MEVLLITAIALWIIGRVAKARRRARAVAELTRAFDEAHRALAEQSACIEAARAELADMVSTVAGMRDLLRRHGGGGGDEGRDDPPPSGPLPDPLRDLMARRAKTGAGRA
ncbi:hypothetical protein [Neoroseomonas soli]|uniref:Uncharacterized protein n=1 Tax=Neoroseomonas soli TaxID=1081025 RepID=A0A9X9WVJ5_9PROT|nr:hypothetical protein [Neoroseomonas soli]MBR0671174.1 hypothetical protein [Neoroseomonas soli]